MKDKDAEIIKLAEEIINNIDLNEIPATNIVFKCIRLARLTNDTDVVQLFQYELTGYPNDDNGYIQLAAFELARRANRIFKKRDSAGKLQEYIFTETISKLDAGLSTANEQLKVAYDVSHNITSSNPNQFITPPPNNSVERFALNKAIVENTGKINKLKVAYYNFATGILHYYQFTNIIEGVFNNTKSFIEKYLAQKLPETFKKFNAISDDLKSDNSAHWDNAVHTCRKILKDVADLLYPATEKTIIQNGKPIILGNDQYINRLIAFINNKSTSEKFISLVGSNIKFIGDRLDAVNDAASKGTHHNVSKEEAERYVIYTFMLLGDILKLS